MVAAVLGVQPSDPMDVAVEDDGTLRREPGRRSRVVRPSRELCGTLLATLWNEGSVDYPHVLRNGAAPPRRLPAFHGHLGPCVVLGYSMGLYARWLLRSEGHFDIEAQPTTSGKPPESCFVDGIQLGTGATTGKGNMKPAVKPGPPRATFVARNGKRVTIELKPEVEPLIRDYIKRYGVGATGLFVLAVGNGALFRTTAR